jgi:hypothetical protein
MEVVIFDPEANDTVSTYSGFIYVTDPLDNGNGLSVEVVTLANGTQIINFTWDPAVFAARSAEDIQIYGGYVCDILDLPNALASGWKLWTGVRYFMSQNVFADVVLFFS